jgi:hypothetical protein
VTAPLRVAALILAAAVALTGGIVVAGKEQQLLQTDGAAVTVWYATVRVDSEPRGYVVTAVPTMLGRDQSVPSAHSARVEQLRSALSAQAEQLTATVEQQFVCEQQFV